MAATVHSLPIAHTNIAKPEPLPAHRPTAVLADEAVETLMAKVDEFATLPEDERLFLRAHVQSLVGHLVQDVVENEAQVLHRRVAGLLAVTTGHPSALDRPHLRSV